MHKGSVFWTFSNRLLYRNYSNMQHNKFLLVFMSMYLWQILNSQVLDMENLNPKNSYMYHK